MKKYFTIVVSLWLSIISIFVITQEYTLRTGKEVLLRTVPVDPRDLLRGDYVILNYEISQIPKYAKYDYNETVYVLLKTNNKNIAGVKQVLYKKPEKGLYLEGKIGTCPSTIPFFRGGKCIGYGIESYFVKEGSGRELEKSLSDGALVKVAIDKNGKAKVKGFVK